MISCREFFNACDPVHPLDCAIPQERQSYIDFSPVRKRQMIERMRRNIVQANNSTCLLFTGHSGCGKSTELLRLKSQLQEQENFFVVYCAVDKEVDINDIDVSDILLAIARQVIKTLENDNQLSIEISSHPFQRLLEGIAGFLNTQVAGLAINIPQLGNIGIKAQENQYSVAFGIGEITLKAKDNPNLRALLRNYIDLNITQILRILNNELIEPAIRQLQRQEKQGLVVIVDGLDKVQDTSNDIGENDRRNRPKYLFINRGQQLNQLNCHTVYAIPIGLRFSEERHSLTDVLGMGTDPVVLPMIPVELREGGENIKGMELLRQMVMARAFPSLSERERLEAHNIEQVFDTEKTLKRLCEVSGGYVRSLLRLLRQSLSFNLSENVNSPCVSREHLEEAIIEERERRRLCITGQEQWRLLAQVAKTKQITASPEYQPLLKQLAIFEYHDEQGIWFDVNPILKETQEFKDQQDLRKSRTKTPLVQKDGVSLAYE